MQQGQSIPEPPGSAGAKLSQEGEPARQPTRDAERIALVIVFACVVPVLISIVATSILGDTQRIQDEFHTWLELVGSCIGLAVAMLLWLRSLQDQTTWHLMWVAIALVMMAIMDSAHGMASVGLAWSWLRHSATLLGGCFFALVWVPVPHFVARHRTVAISAAALMALGCSVGIWAWDGGLPAAWTHGQYSPAVIAANGIGGLGFYAAAAFFLRRYWREPTVSDLALGSHTLLFGTAAVLFGFSHVWAPDWWVWHLSRFIAYIVILMAAYGVVTRMNAQILNHNELLELRVQERTEELQRLASIVSSSEDAIYSKSLEGIITSWNTGAEKIFGYSAEEMLGQSVMKIVPPGGEEEVVRFLRAIGSGEAVQHSEIQRVRKDGKRVHVSSSLSPMLDRNGAISGASVIARDITRQQEAEEHLHHAAARMRRLVDSNVVGIVIATPSGGIVEANDYYLRLVGYTREEYERGLLDWRTITPPEWLPVDERAIAELRQKGSCSAYEKEYVRRDGSRVSVLLSDTMLPGPEEQIAAFVLDMTERKRMEAARGESEEKLRLILDSTAEAICGLDFDGKFTFCNPASLRMLGLSSAESLLGKNVHKVLHHSYATGAPLPEKQCPILLGVRGGVGIHLPEETFWRADGSSFPAECWSFPLLHDGKPIGAVLTFLDVTERKRAEAALRESENKFRTLANSVPQMVWMCTPDGLNVYFNQRWFDYTGMTPEESYGRGWNTPFHDDDRQEAWDAWNHAVATGETYIVESRLRAVDGTFRWFLMQGTPMREQSGNIVMWFGTCTDIEDLKAAESEIRQLNADLEQRVLDRTSQLEAANKELEAFTYSVSHDLRAPLRHITGFARMLVEECGDELSPHARHYLDVVCEGTQHMGALVDDLLNLGRVGRQSLSIQITGLNSVVEEVVRELKAQNAGRDIAWQVQSLPFVECDPGLMKQVFANLLSNAVKYSSRREHAVIEVGVLEPGPTIFVRDNGVGFSMKYADKLFGIFQRLHRAEDFPGTGVGLATVQRILHKHGGRIWATAELDKGATFFFQLARDVDSSQVTSTSEVEIGQK